MTATRNFGILPAHRRRGKGFVCDSTHLSRFDELTDFDISVLDELKKGAIRKCDLCKRLQASSSKIASAILVLSRVQGIAVYEDMEWTSSVVGVL